MTENEVEYPVRCRIVNATGELIPGIERRTPEESKPHIGKEGLVEKVDEYSVRITLDDGTILWGYDCWWIPLKEKDHCVGEQDYE